MNKRQLEKLSNYIENEVLNNINGIRRDGDNTSEKRRFLDTWYHCGFEVNYDFASNKLSLSTEMIADKDFINEDGFSDEYENAYVHIAYDISLDSLEVEIYSDEENQFMQDILFDLECRIQEDSGLNKILRKISPQHQKNQSIINE